MLNVVADNPVARHTLRLISRSGRAWAVGLMLFAAAAVGAVLQIYWMERDMYSFSPNLAVRWLGLTLVAETVVALPWAAVRGALLWRLMKRDGHLEEYRRSRMSPGRIAFGALMGVMAPVLALLVLSTVMSLAVRQLTAGLEVRHLLTAHPLTAHLLTAHLLLAAQCAAFGALGLWLSGKMRYPAAAVPVSLSLLGAAMGAIWALDPFYPSLGAPEPWIYFALLPNPVTAVGNALDTDVLRFSWIYQRIHAHEYFYVYPPAWQTGGLYAVTAAVLLALTGRRVAMDE
jgi:hypothetical protein